MRGLPVNLTTSTRLLARTAGDDVLDIVADDGAAGLALEHAAPIRRFYAWRGKRNYEGSWWSSTNRAHVGFESLLERDFLLEADFRRDVVAVSSQPFALLWPYRGRGRRYHVPDYFARLDSGDGLVVDVKPTGRVDAAGEQFAMTREVCSRIGWGYEVFTGLVEPNGSNLRWLAGFRHDRFTASSQAVRAILAAFDSGRPLGDGIRRATASLQVEGSLVHAWTLNLIFTGRLACDLGQAPLTMRTAIRRRSAAAGSEVAA
jgi:hypothetical protein